MKSILRHCLIVIAFTAATVVEKSFGDEIPFEDSGLLAAIVDLQATSSGVRDDEFSRLKITVDDSWDLDDTSNVSNILYEAANYLYVHLRNKPRIDVVVGYDLEQGPIALYRGRYDRVDRVLLSNTPLEYRPQIIYQFSHEFCHVISDYNRVRSSSSKNGWFHESLCELASIFVLHATGEPELENYLGDYHEGPRRVLSGIQDFRAWMLDKEQELRSRVGGQYDRDSNAVVAYRLLPLFVEHPKLWNTLWNLPKSESRLFVYIEEWKKAVAVQERALLDKLQERLLGFS